MKNRNRALSVAATALQFLGHWWLSLGAVTGAAAIPAQAATLPSASTFVQCFADGNNSFHSTECAQGGFIGVPPSAFASATLSPFPSVTVEVTSPPAAALGAGADANATYRFGVTGGNVGDVVPIMVDFSLSLSVTPESSALARLIIRTTEVPFTVEELVCNPQVCDETALSDTLTIQARSGSTLDSVTLYVLAQSPATHVSHESARAFADPFIYIDPAFPNANLYSIIVSPGVGNAPDAPLASVPEPATLVLVSSVVGVLGLMRRRCSYRKTGQHEILPEFSRCHLPARLLLVQKTNELRIPADEIKHRVIAESRIGGHSRFRGRL
jgi:hypothetical protein